MRRLLFVALLALAFVVESHVRIAGLKPELTMLFAYYVGLRQGPLRGLLAGALIGAVEDGVSGAMLGPNMTAIAAVGYLAFFIRGGFFVWTPVLGLIWVFVLTLLGGIVSYASLSVFSLQPATLSGALLAIFLQATLNSPAGFLIRPAEDG